MGILYLDQAWTLQNRDDQLVCSAGADQLFAIDEIDHVTMELLLELGKKGKFETTVLPKRAMEIAEQLLAAGIVLPRLPSKGKTSRLGIVGLNQDLLAMKQLAESLGATIVAQQKADILLVFRTNQSFAELLEELDYSNLATPHLLIDLAYHHTISLGPLVFPGQTACLACLQGRLTNRWGDDQPPIKPAMNTANELALQLLKLELSKIINSDDYSLVQKTVVYDFEARSIDINPLYKVPICPVCANNSLDISGKIALPWV